MNTNMKKIAAAMACLQLYACASDGYRMQSTWEATSEIYHLKPVAAQTAWQRGNVVALSDDDDLPMMLGFVETGATGLVFSLTAENDSQENINVLSEDFSCSQIRTDGESPVTSAILSESEALANYDKLLDANEQNGQPGATDAGEALGLFFIFAALFAIIFDVMDDSDHSHHASSSHRPKSAANTHRASHVNHARHSHHADNAHVNIDGIIDLAADISDDSHRDQSAVAERKEISARRIAASKADARNRLFQSDTLLPGDYVHGQIICPFKTVGASGIEIRYRERSFRFIRDRVDQDD